MTLQGKSVLITGANRGIGRALVDEALNRQARVVYAAMRQSIAIADPRVTRLALDVTDPAQVRAAAEQVDSLDMLINNAGIGVYDDLSDRAPLEQHLAVNLYGTLSVTQAFLPKLIDAKGTIVNILSTAALTALPFIPAYSISKAAALALTQSHRALLARQEIDVHAVLAGPVDTDMSKDLHVPKVAPEYVASAVFDGVENGQDDIFPDPMLQPLAQDWLNGEIKSMERHYTSLTG